MSRASTRCASPIQPRSRRDCSGRKEWRSAPAACSRCSCPATTGAASRSPCSTRASIARVGVAAPYAAFADSPEARAVSGALDLDTLVVAPAGNDGPAGPGYGSIASPGGAPDALTVGAADVRTQAEDVPVTVRTGLRLLLDRRLPLAGAVVPSKPLELELAAPRVSAHGLD